jgi:hypothetical protein
VPLPRPPHPAASDNGDTILHRLVSFDDDHDDGALKEEVTMLLEGGAELDATPKAAVRFGTRQACSNEAGTPLHRAVGGGTLVPRPRPRRTGRRLR